MKLKESRNPNIYYSFGNKHASLRNVKSGLVDLTCSGEEVNFSSLVLAEQTHSAEIKLIEPADLGSGFLDSKPEIPIVDGFVSNLPNVFLVIKTADCVPILVYSKNTPAIGACHSGREGTKKGIVKNLIQAMLSNFALAKTELVVLVGPCISGKNYQVDQATFADFVLATGVEQENSTLDLQKVILHDILELGILRENVHFSKHCTFSDDSYFSYRENKTTERQLSIIGIKDGKIHK